MLDLSPPPLLHTQGFQQFSSQTGPSTPPSWTQGSSPPCTSARIPDSGMPGLQAVTLHSPYLPLTGSDLLIHSAAIHTHQCLHGNDQTRHLPTIPPLPGIHTTPPHFPSSSSFGLVVVARIHRRRKPPLFGFLIIYFERIVLSNLQKMVVCMFVRPFTKQFWLQKWYRPFWNRINQLV